MGCLITLLTLLLVFLVPSTGPSDVELTVSAVVALNSTQAVFATQTAETRAFEQTPTASEGEAPQVTATPLTQTVNLLANPGFESPYVTFPDNPPRVVAQGWTPWHVPRTEDMPSFQNVQPEYAPVAPDTTRIHSGNNAQLYSSFFAMHDGGVFQRVTGITRGTELLFSVYAYVWSTAFSDRNLSEEDGDVWVRVGIDSTGGTDGTSENIVWSAPVERYDRYREYIVTATAESSTVTVFVRSTVGVPVQNNYIYLDDAFLVPVSES